MSESGDPPVASPAVPVCYRHPRRETYVRCTRCDRPICPDCMNEASVGHQCPECVNAGRRTARPVRTVFGGSRAGEHGYVTTTLLALNVLAALVTVAFGGAAALVGRSVTPLHEWGAVVPALRAFAGGPVVEGVAAGEYYRLFTAMFLHYGLIHLLLNMWALWLLGRYLERALGPARFLAVYLVSGLGGSVAAYLFAAPNSATAGASGAIFGLFSALFLVNRRLGADNSGVIALILLNLGFTFLVPTISISGHLGGLVTGALVGAGLAYAPRRNRTAVQVAVVLGTVGLLTLLVALRTASLTAV